MSEETEVMDLVVEILSERQPRRKVEVLREVLGYTPNARHYGYAAAAVRTGRILCDGAGYLSLPADKIPLANTFEDDVVDALVAADKPLSMEDVFKAMGAQWSVEGVRRITQMIDDGEITRAPKADGGGIFILVED